MSKLVVYAGNVPRRHEIAVAAGIFSSVMPSSLDEVRRIECWIGEQRALVFEPYYGSGRQRTSQITWTGTRIRLKLRWLPWFLATEDDEPLLAELSGPRDPLEIVLQPTDFANLGALADGLGFGNDLMDLRSVSVTVPSLRKPGPGDDAAARLRPDLVCADALAKPEDAPLCPTLRFGALPVRVESTGQPDALLLFLEAEHIPGISTRVLNRFGDGVLVRGRQLRQIQAAEHLQAVYDAQRLEMREHWLELAGTTASNLLSRWMSDPMAMALDTLRGSSGVSFLPLPPSDQAVRLRWRIGRSARPLTVDAHQKIGVEHFHPRDGLAVRLQRPPRWVDDKVGHGTWLVSQVNTHAGTDLAISARPIDPWNPPDPGPDKLDIKPHSFLLPLTSVHDFGREACTWLYAIEARRAQDSVGLRLGSMDLWMPQSAVERQSRPGSGGWFGVSALLEGLAVGRRSRHRANIAEAHIFASDLPVVRLLPGSDDPLPGEETVGASARDPVLIVSFTEEAQQPASARLQVAEHWKSGRERSLKLSLMPPPAAAPVTPSAGVSHAGVLLIDTGTLFIARLDGLELLTGEVGGSEQLASYIEGEDGAPRWRVVWNDASARSLRLPPQVLGEEMEKGGRKPVSTIEPGALLDYRLSSPARLTIKGSALDQNLQETSWNWRRVFGYPGQREPGAEISLSNFELLYGLRAQINGENTTQSVRWVEAYARRGDLSPAIMLAPVEDAATALDRRLVARELHRLRWEHTRQSLGRRPAMLELEQDGRRPQPGESVSRALIDRGVSFHLRSAADLKYPTGARPAGSAAPDGTLAGGVGWPFESTNIYEEIWRNPHSVSGELGEPILTALGGYGDYKTAFALGKSVIRGRTALGRSEIVAVERIGRIAQFWHRAKHVIVYERSTLPSEQMDCKQPRHGGRPIVRKMDEYVEILQPERRYPEQAGAAMGNAMLKGVRFISRRIPVLSRWGQDTPQGFEVPLWHPAADPSIYAKPVVMALLAGDPQADAAEHLAAFSEPQNLRFYTSTDDRLDANSDHWPAFASIDYIDQPRPQPDTLPAMDPNDGDASIPDAVLIPPGFERFTHRLDRGPPSNLLAARGDGVLSARLEAITLMRGRLSQGAQSPTTDTLRTLGSARELRQQVQSLIAQAQQIAAAGETGFADRLKPALATAAHLRSQADALNSRAVDSAEQLEKWQQQLSGAASLCTPLREQARDFLNEQQQALFAQFDQLSERLLENLQGSGNTEVATVHRWAREQLRALEDARRDALMDVGSPLFRHGFEAIENTARALQSALSAARDRAATSWHDARSRLDSALGPLPDLRPLKAQAKEFRQSLISILDQIESQLPAEVPSLARPLLSELRKRLRLQLMPLRALPEQMEQLIDQQTDPTRLKAAIRQALADAGTILLAADGPFDLGRIQVDRLAATAQRWITAARDELDGHVVSVNRWSSAAIAALEGAIDQAAVDGHVGIDTLRAQLDSELRSLKLRLGRAFSAGANVLEAEIKDLCAHWSALFQPVADLGHAAQQHLAALAEQIKDRLAALEAPSAAKLERIAESARQWLEQRGSALRELADGAEQALKRLGQAPSLADPDETLRLIRAVGEGPLLPEIRFNRERVAYFFDDARRAIETSPMAALVNRADKDLAAFGLRIPTRELLDQITPDRLKGFDLSSIFPDFAGLKNSGLFKALRLPEIPSDKIQLRHGFDKDSQTAWLAAQVDVELPGSSPVFAFGPLELILSAAAFRAHSRLTVGLDGIQRKETEGSIQGDWTLSISKQPLASFRRTRLRYTDGRLRFELEPKNIELNELIRWISDAVRTFGGEEDGLRLELIDADTGVPKGLRAILDLPVPVVGAGAVTILGLNLGARFELRFSPRFELGVGFNVASEKQPFTIFIAFLGGGGWLDAQARYLPEAGQEPSKLGSLVTLGISAGAGVGLNLGPMRGSVVILLSVYGRYLKPIEDNAGTGGLSLALSLLIRGHATLWGWLHIDVVVLLVLTYQPNGALIGTGSLRVSVRISRFFKVSFSTGIRYEFKKGSGGASALPATAGRLARSA